jgi:inosine-uridine nucleoside N-ribohydrolase
LARKVILDVDTGADDAVALLLAGHHRALDLAAVTVTHGNAPLGTTLDNTLRLMQAGGLGHVPIFAGARRALVAGPPPSYEAQLATLPLPPASLQAQPGHAVAFLIDYYMGPDGPATTYVPLGPQTNLALALRLEPRLAQRIPHIVTMAGAYIEGNVTPSAEFNIYADPEAAYIVYNAGIPLTMVGLEVTAQAVVTVGDVAGLRGRGTRLAGLSAGLIEFQIRWFIENQGAEGGQVYDACAVAAVVEPDILRTRQMRVDIELHGELTRGRTVADISSSHQRPPNVAMGVGINRERFIQLLLEGLA